MKLAALVPIRHHSQRVPGKNYRLLNQKPLFHYILTTLKVVAEIDGIYVDTDSQTIIEGVQQHFPGVQIIPRPEHLCADDTPMNEILLYDTEQVQADFYLQTHATNPLLSSKVISDAILTFQASYPANDSLFSVTRWQTRLYDQAGKAINHDPTVLIQTQDLPPVYEENSCIYIFSRDNLVKYHHRIGSAPLLFEIPRLEAIDIDEESDFQLAEVLMRLQRKTT